MIFAKGHYYIVCLNVILKYFNKNAIDVKLLIVCSLDLKLDERCAICQFAQFAKCVAQFQNRHAHFANFRPKPDSNPKPNLDPNPNPNPSSI